MASPNLSEIVTTTIENRSGKLSDNVSENTALLSRLRKKNKIRTVSGGRNIVEELSYAENGTYKRYSGYEVLDISPSDVFTAAEFSWKQIAAAVTISGLEGLQNSGKEAIIDLLEGRVENAETTFTNNMSTDIYSLGTADGGKQINGIQALVSDTGLGTVGGIDSSTWTFWQNQIYDASVESVTLSSTTIQEAMNELYLRCTRNRDQPDLIVADNIFYKYYWASLQANQRFTDPDMAKAGFMSLKFQNADVVFDGGQGGDCPASHMYFLNTDHISLRPHKDRNIVPLNPERHSVNQDAIVKLIGWAGNMTVRNRALQGVMLL